MDTFHTALRALLMFWGAITAVLVCALIYRSMLSTHEDDQIFLDPANMAASEQRALVSRIERLSRPITVLLVSSGTLLVVIGGLWLWEGFRNF